MITLRYHIITLVAVFLSLGLGIILGGSIGQNWINEKQQTLLIGLEEKYDQAVTSNEMLQQQIQELSIRMEQANEEFSTFVSKGYLTDLSGKRIGVWQEQGRETEALHQLFLSVGLEIVLLNEQDLQQDLSFPIVLVGETLPDGIYGLTSDQWLQVQSTNLTPSEQWELLQSIRELYKENGV